MILVDDKKILFLKFFFTNNNGKIFNYLIKDKEIKEVNTISEDSTFIIMKKNNSFFRVDNQSNIESKKGELLLFRIRKNKSDIYILENPIPTKISEDNSNSLNIKLWLIINSIDDKKNEKIEKNIINRDYYLNKNDILKFGNIKYIVLEIKLKNENIDNNDNNSKEDTLNEEKNDYYDIAKLNKNTNQIFDFYPSPKECYDFLDEKNSIICYICKKNKCNKENPIIKFCNCNYVHYECLKNQIKSTIIVKKNVKNYYFRYFTCKKCKFVYPLKFKISDTKFELFDIERPNNDSNYIILESVENNFYYGHIKLIHVIELNNETKSIRIGRKNDDKDDKNDNDVIICEPSVSKHHAILTYNPEEGTVLIKNISKTFGTLVLIKKSLEITDNEIQIEIGKVFMEAKTMTFGKFVKDKHTKYPLPKKE